MQLSDNWDGCRSMTLEEYSAKDKIKLCKLDCLEYKQLPSTARDAKHMITYD